MATVTVHIFTFYFCILLLSSTVPIDDQLARYVKRMQQFPFSSGPDQVKKDPHQAGNLIDIWMHGVIIIGDVHGETMQLILSFSHKEDNGWKPTKLSALRDCGPKVLRDHATEWMVKRSHSYRTSSSLLLATLRHNGSLCSYRNFSVTVEGPTYPRTICTCTTLAVETSSQGGIPVVAYHDCSCLVTVRTGDVDASGTAAITSLLQQTLLLFTKFHFRLSTVVSEKMIVFNIIEILQRTKCVSTSYEIFYVLKHTNLSEAVILFTANSFRLLSTEGELSETVLSSCLHRNSSTNNSLTSILHALSRSHRKHNNSVNDTNNVRTCIRVSFAAKISPPHFSLLHYKYVTDILCLLVLILNVRSYSRKKEDENQNTKPAEKRIRVGSAWFSIGSDKVKYNPDVDWRLSNKSLLWHIPSVLYDIIHHPWRHSPQRMSNVSPHTSVTLQRHKNYKCLSSTSTLCAVCQSPLRFHRRRTNDHSDASTTESNTSTISPEGAPFSSQAVIHVYPVSRFLPDPTRNPGQDLAHVGYRLATLSALPATFPVSRIRLADAGFYSRGVRDEVTCYSCHVQHSGWTREDNPLEVHRRLSPNCRHLLQRDEMEVSGTAASGSATATLSCMRGSGEATSDSRSHGASNFASANGYMEDGDGSSLSTNSGHAIIPSNTATTEPSVQHSSTSRSRGAENHSTTAGDRIGNNSASVTGRTDTASSAASTRAAPGINTPASRLPSGTSGDRRGAVEHSSTNPSGTNAGTQNTTTERTNPGGPTTVSGSSVTPTSDTRPPGSSTNENPPRSLFPRAGLELGGAVYPMYQDMASRRRSFTRWDETRAPALTQILLSGMFYAGYSDCVRCFYCGVGLKHWVVTDNVWAEHVRWRPECQYLRAVKGDDFIRNTQRRLGIAVPESSEGASRNPSGSSSATSSQRQQQSAPLSTSTAATASTATTSLAATTTTTALGQATASLPQTRVGGAQPHGVRISGLASDGASSGSSSRTEPRRNDGPTAAAVAPSRNSSSGHSSRNSGRQNGAENTSGGASAIVEMSEAEEQQTLSRLQTENRTLARSLQCKVCHRAPIDTILLPCAHLVICETCAGSVTSCPLCHEGVQATSRVYMT